MRGVQKNKLIINFDNFSLLMPITFELSRKKSSDNRQKELHNSAIHFKSESRLVYNSINAFFLYQLIFLVRFEKSKE